MTEVSEVKLELKQEEVEEKEEKSQYEETEEHYHLDNKKKVVDNPTPFEGCKTLPANLDEAVKKFGDKIAVQNRKIKCFTESTITNSEGKKLDVKIPEFYKELEQITYKQMHEHVNNFAVGIKNFMKVDEKIEETEDGFNCKNMIGIYCTTRYEWMVCLHGANKNGITGTTFYPNLEEDNLVYILNETKLETIFINSSLLGLLERVKDKVPALKRIVYCLDLEDEASKKKIESSVYEVKSFYEIIESGKNIREKAKEENKEIVYNYPKATDATLIMFTSGTTGRPKGVIIRHDNLVPMCVSCWVHMLKYLTEPRVLLAVLPLSHIFEMFLENTVLFYGGILAYGDTKTLADQGAHPYGDFFAFKPKVFCGVPLIYDKIRKKIDYKIKKANPLIRWLFNTGFKAKKKAVLQGKETPFWNKVLFKKFIDSFGGRIELLCSGGAALPADVSLFMKVLVSPAKIKEGYGATENTGAATMQRTPDNWKGACIGDTNWFMKSKLRSVPEMGYSVKDKNPKGEIMFWGPSVCTNGYFRKPELTKKTFENGWFKTGDICVRNPDNTYSILDRKKDIRKLQNGEFFAPAMLEATLMACKYAKQIAVIAGRKAVNAIIVCDKAFIVPYMKEKGIKETYEKYIQSEKFKNLVIDDLVKIGKEAKIKTHELVHDILVTTTEWTIKNNCLSQTMKVKRNNIIEMYKDEIIKMK